MSDAKCCKDAKTVTKLSFLEGKAINFKKYIEGFAPDAEVRSYIDSFKPEMLVHTISTIIVPLVKLGQVETTVDELCAHLTIPETQVAEGKAKLKQYLHMFHDVLLE